MIRVYQSTGPYGFTAPESLLVFKQFFDAYERYEGQEHPKINRRQIRKILEAMPHLEDETGRDLGISPEDYEHLIEDYFETVESCDHNINHFFSGDVRLIRYYSVI